MNTIKFQKFIAFFSILLFLGKMLAWLITGSVMVLTDALEGIVNVVTGFLGLYCIILAAKPRDANHPFGHSKVEFLSSAVEGVLIVLSGFVIIFEGVDHLIHKHELEKLDVGLLIICFAGSINYIIGVTAAKIGKKRNSMILIAAGKHLITDAYSSIAIILGLALLVLIQRILPNPDRFLWIDSIVSIVFALVILVTGYKVIKSSIRGIMDEVDINMQNEIIEALQDNRKPEWIDLHNLRVIKYGNILHMDAHLSLPRYFAITDAEKEIIAIEELIKNKFGWQVEMFIHLDSCESFQCKICALSDCKIRESELTKTLKWEFGNVGFNEKHGMS